MIHTLQVMLETLYAGLLAHLSDWDGWAVVIAAALFGWQRAALWMPAVVAIVVNPMPYGLFAALVHGRHPGFTAAALFTLIQIVLAYGGYVLGRVASRFR